ncbi:VOC family protein [Synechococcus sp. H60.3]|uniref:VOC family protein n=1 Tax=unclassified Synechococcus TaxID=2626047 RepID=UPI0039C411DC
MNQSIRIVQGIHHLHFYLWDLPRWREHFCRVWGFRLESEAGNTLDLRQGSLRVRLSQPARAGDEVDRYLQQHSPGVVDVALAVGEQELPALAELLRGRGAPVEWIPAAAALCLHTPYGIRHSLVPGPSNVTPAEAGLFSHWDHVVLNVEQGSLQAAADWYGQVLGWRHLYRYSIHTDTSGLESVVVGDPEAGIQWAINEPTCAASQIQEFLDAHGGPGIQHAALHSPDIVASLRRLRQGGVDFLQVPPQYYTSLERELGLALRSALGQAISWQDLVEQQILLDATLPASDGQDRPLLLQTFTQPLFGRPTFFFEVIQRVGGAAGFGEANFQALFEALERQQRQRQQALIP